MAAIATASMLIVVASFGAIAWRYFNPILLETITSGELTALPVEPESSLEKLYEVERNLRTVIGGQFDLLHKFHGELRTEFGDIQDKVTSISYEIKTSQEVLSAASLRLENLSANFDHWKDTTRSVLYWRWMRDIYIKIISEISAKSASLADRSELDQSPQEWQGWKIEMRRWNDQADFFFNIAHEVGAFNSVNYIPSAQELAEAEWTRTESDYPSPLVCTAFRTMRLRLRMIEDLEREVTDRINSISFIAKP